MTSNNAVIFINQNRVGKSELLNTGGDLLYLVF
jgi:hypothetical protein